MNLEKFHNIIALYKKHFKYIDEEERYKWTAVRWFQDHWNIEVQDFPAMLWDAMGQTSNLLDAGQAYTPRAMIHKLALKEPETVREIFKTLYNEELDLIFRFNNFKDICIELRKKYFPDKRNQYQDHRAVVVYLCLKYPNRYFLYKYEMFKDFIPLVEIPYKIKNGADENMTQYFTYCNVLNNELKKDSELLELHSQRLTKTEFFDDSFNILTQDIVYAAVKHLPKFEEIEQTETTKPISERLQLTPLEISPIELTPKLKGAFKNYVKNAERNKRIGDLGEDLVMIYEKDKLSRLKINKIPEHKSRTEGDGLGYDILSYNENGRPIYIEVKCTTYGKYTSFYLTGSELKMSGNNKYNYYLYRLYNYDEKTDTAKFFIKPGDLIDLCINPAVYKVAVEKK